MDENSVWDWFGNSLCSCLGDRETDHGKINSWSDLQNILWLLHSFRSDLINANEFSDDGNAVSNFQKIQKVAECELGVPRLLDKTETDSVESKLVDDLPFFTYVSSLYANLEKTIPNCISNKKTSKEKPPLKIAPQNFLWCNVCQTDVRLFERFYVDDNVLHRKCFVCQRCKKRLHVGLYRTTTDGVYICLDHEKEDLLKKLNENEQKIADAVEKTNRNDELTAKPEILNVCESREPISDAFATPASDKPEGDPSCVEPPSLSTDETQLSSSDEKQLKIMGDAQKNVKIPPTAPPRRKKLDVSPTPEANQQTNKPVPPVRTKLKPKNAEEEGKNLFDDIVLRNDTKKEAAKSPSMSTNPFGSDDEFDDSASTLSDSNPFNDSDYDSEIAEANRRKSLMSAPDNTRSRHHSDMTKSYTAGATTLDAPDSRSKNRSPSNSSSKKRPAPPPPPSSKPVSKPGDDAMAPVRTRKKRPAPPRPLPFRRQIRSEILMKPEEILSNINSTDDEIFSLEERGRLTEDEIRQHSSTEDANLPKELIQKWLEMVHFRMQLVHRESEYAFLWRERQLDELHAEIEFQLRCIIEKPESEKRDDDNQKEAYLLQKLLHVIDEKSHLAESNIAENTSLKLKSSDELELSSSETGKNVNSNEKQVKKKKHLKLRLKKLKKKLISG